ncbi:hypothetical protein [Mucilaginibacter polytrichastri]|uniref:hypothetical protein n=1 Tax=Mucilaginibacter polytrichastri TaxID=1302689 RepID=UPI00209B01A0|nr:hypothetical protein [Mucilaginibacter polytrichastri]
MSDEELQRIAGKDFDNERLSNVRDIFLFSCYTGLAYVDVKNLKRGDIQKGGGWGTMDLYQPAKNKCLIKDPPLKGSA